MRAPRKIYELEEAERELSAVLEEMATSRIGEFEFGILAGKLAALRWALGSAQGPIAPLRDGAQYPAATPGSRSADGEPATG
jgi:hypothetical protein